jgi:hypothetical protein
MTMPHPEAPQAAKMPWDCTSPQEAVDNGYGFDLSVTIALPGGQMRHFAYAKQGGSVFIRCLGRGADLGGWRANTTLPLCGSLACQQASRAQAANSA